ncbi:MULTISPECIES: TetR/AcrR family transcriptional regulator [Isoptericola]|uniref:Helix-turn-helix domain-containing protein n=1 Tax=Isoptericola haloaureus TaxID=1542902 RepID=A0ABU7ZA99_9MICO|nr:TetR/AcrR family transcriptional regulator [Isoptericola sp. AK164]
MTTEHATSVRSARRERTRERLLDAAFALFSEHGVAATPIEAICEAAGFTRGAFYSNFGSREELFHALVERKARDHLRSLEQLGPQLAAARAATPEGFRDAVRQVLVAFELDEEEHRLWCLMNAEFELMAMRDPEVAQQYVGAQNRLRGEVAAVIDGLLEQFDLRFIVDTPTAVDLLMCVEDAGSRAAVLGAPADQQAIARLERLVDLLVTPR